MRVKVLTSTMTYTKSTRKGVVIYSLSVNEFGGYASNNENGRIIERAIIGRLVQISQSSDRASLDKYIKQCRAAGDIVELEGEHLRYGL